MTTFARKPPKGWREIDNVLARQLEGRGVPVVVALTQRPRFLAPPWAVRLSAEWPAGDYSEDGLFALAVRAITLKKLGADEDESTDAVLATIHLGGVAAVARMLGSEEWTTSC